MKKTRRVFSESFKRDKVQLYEKGKMSVLQMSKLYDISETSLYKWIDRYRTSPKSDRIVIESESDYVKLLELQKRVEAMARLIGDQQIKIEYQQAVIKAVSEHYEEDVEKKFG